MAKMAMFAFAGVVVLGCAPIDDQRVVPIDEPSSTIAVTTLVVDGSDDTTTTDPPMIDGAEPIPVAPPDDLSPTAEWPDFIEVSGVTYDVPYGPDPENVLDIYLPTEKVFERLPIVLFIHGGAWSGGDRDHLLSFSGPLLDMLDEGWAVASVGYRTTNVAPHPAQLIDVQRAILWAREIAPAIGLDPESVVVAGHSAGGHLAMLAGTFDGSADPVVDPASASRPDGVIAIAPVTDLIAFAEADRSQASAVGALLGCPDTEPLCDRLLAEWLSPMYHLDPDDPPLYLAHGRADSLVPFVPHATIAYQRYAGILGPHRVWFNVVADENHDVRGVDGGSLSTFLARVRSGSIT